MDGRHDGACPWFKNEMGASLMGACREKAALLIVVADHGISGLRSPMGISSTTVVQAHVAVTEESRRLRGYSR